MTKRSEELGFGKMTSDSDNLDWIASGNRHNDATIAPPVVDSNNLYRGEEHEFLPCTEGGGWPYQYTWHDNLTSSDDVTNASLNLNSAEKLDSGGKCVIPTDSSASRPQMFNPNGTPMSDIIGQPLANMNLRMTQFNPNQAGTEPLLTPEKLDERFMTVGSGSKSNYIMPKVNVTGNSQRPFGPPINTYHNQLGSRSLVNPGFDMTGGAFTGFQKDSGTLSNIEHTGGHQTPSNSGAGLHLGPSHGFQRPALGVYGNHQVNQINRHLDQQELPDVGQKIQFERSMGVPSFPSVGTQTLPCESRQNGVSGRPVPSSIRMVTDQSPFELLNNENFSSNSFARPPFVMDTRSRRGQDPSGNNCQPQVAGFIQQSSSRLGQHSASGQGIQSGKGNMTVQVSRPPTISSRKRGASEQLRSTVLDQRRRTLPTQPFNHPSIPTWSRLASSVPHTPQSIHPLIHTAQSLTPQLASLVPNTSLSTPYQQLIAQTPVHLRTPNQQLIAQALAYQRRSLIPPPNLPNQQLIAQPLARQRTHHVSPSHLPNQQLIAQPLSHQSTHLIPPLPKQQQIAQPLSQPLARQSTHLVPPPHLLNQQLIAQHLARESTHLIPPLPNHQQIAQPLARQCTQPISPRPNQQFAHHHTQLATNVTRDHIRNKDQTPKPDGYNCRLCKRDLAYEPEGPISQPTIPPTVAVLSCGHTFHAYCLERITPDDQSEDPPCIPCALGE